MAKRIGVLAVQGAVVLGQVVGIRRGTRHVHVGAFVGQAGADGTVAVGGHGCLLKHASTARLCFPDRNDTTGFVQL